MNATQTTVFHRVYYTDRAGNVRTAEQPTRAALIRWCEAHMDDIPEVLRTVKVTRRAKG